MQKLLNIAINAAIEAKKAAQVFINDPQIISAEYKDIKSQADICMSNLIIKNLKKTNIYIISEEDIFQTEYLPEKYWIIDPLDGTYNFCRNFQCAGISISLIINSEPMLGVILDIYNDKIFTSYHNNGAKLNKESIKVSKINKISDAILATGFPSGSQYDKINLLSFVHSVQEFKKIRSIGSASIMLSYVATGIFDVYYERNIYLWDVAAGLSMVKEAGGNFLLLKTDIKFKYNVLASNSLIFESAKKHFFK
jgi:myo-inositol-1(or 4)-monophosphatase